MDGRTSAKPRVGGIVTRVRQVADEIGERVKGVRPLTVIVPVGFSDVPAQIDELSPGRYLIEADLPSGELLIKDIIIEPESGEQEVVLSTQPPPREWLGWQHFSGKVASAARYAGEVERSKGELPGGRPAREPYAAIQTRSVGPSPATSPESGKPDTSARGSIPEPAPQILTGLGDGFRMQFEDIAAGLEVPVGKARPLAEVMPLTRVGEEVAADELHALFRIRDIHTERRSYLWLADRTSSELVSLPAPWFSVESREPVPVELLIRHRPNRAGFRVSVSVADPHFGVALAYMGRGDFPNGARVFTAARDMLYAKRSNPLAAAAGGYLLVATAAGKPDADWYNWINNLSEWFKDLPDGMILRGSLRMRAGDADGANEVLTRAYRRGLPYYSLGITMLLDGLTRLSAHDPDDRELASMAKTVNVVARRANMDEIFTSIRLRRPSD